MTVKLKNERKTEEESLFSLESSIVGKASKEVWESKLHTYSTIYKCSFLFQNKQGTSASKSVHTLLL